MSCDVEEVMERLENEQSSFNVRTPCVFLFTDVVSNDDFEQDRYVVPLSLVIKYRRKLKIVCNIYNLINKISTLHASCINNVLLVLCRRLLVVIFVFSRSGFFAPHYGIKMLLYIICLWLCMMDAGL